MRYLNIIYIYNNEKISLSLSLSISRFRFVCLIDCIGYSKVWREREIERDFEKKILEEYSLV